MVAGRRLGAPPLLCIRRVSPECHLVTVTSSSRLQRLQLKWALAACPLALAAAATTKGALLPWTLAPALAAGLLLVWAIYALFDTTATLGMRLVLLLCLPSEGPLGNQMAAAACCCSGIQSRVLSSP